MTEIVLSVGGVIGSGLFIFWTLWLVGQFISSARAEARQRPSAGRDVRSNTAHLSHGETKTGLSDD